MSATTTAPMTVTAARQRLRDTSGLSSQQIDDAQRAIDQFYAAKPAVSQACAACRCQVWEERVSKAGVSVWCCAGCGRLASLTADQWHAEDKARRQAADAHLKATAASAPDPRQNLREALTRLATAKATLSKLEAAQPAARSTLAAAVLKHERSEAELAEVDGRAAEHLAGSFLGGKTTGPAPSAAAARTALAAAAALSAARGAKTLFDSQIADARTAVATSQSFARKAATAVIAHERLEPLLAEVVEARAAYCEGIGILGWLLRAGAIPSSDARARQLVADANTPPSAWPEAKTAGVQPMEAALTALMADPEAVV